MKYQIKSPYILYVGAIEPRKNIPVLINAFHKVLKKYPDYQLVLAGRPGWKNDEVFSLITRLSIVDKVTITGYVEENDLPAIYQGAKVFVYPSLYEGFGLPPIEALASDTPTIAYNSPSLHTKFVENILPGELSEKIINSITKPVLPKTKIPSWEETAKNTLSLYEDMMN